MADQPALAPAGVGRSGFLPQPVAPAAVRSPDEAPSAVAPVGRLGFIPTAAGRSGFMPVSSPLKRVDETPVGVGRAGFLPPSPRKSLDESSPAGSVGRAGFLPPSPRRSQELPRRSQEVPREDVLRRSGDDVESDGGKRMTHSKSERSEDGAGDSADAKPIASPTVRDDAAIVWVVNPLRALLQERPELLARLRLFLGRPATLIPLRPGLVPVALLAPSQQAPSPATQQGASPALLSPKGGKTRRGAEKPVELEWCAKCKGRRCAPQSTLCIDCNSEAASSDIHLLLHLGGVWGSRNVRIRKGLNWKSVCYVIECELGEEALSKGLVVRSAAGVESPPISNDNDWSRAVLETGPNGELALYPGNLELLPAAQPAEKSGWKLNLRAMVSPRSERERGTAATSPQGSPRAGSEDISTPPRHGSQILSPAALRGGPRAPSPVSSGPAPRTSVMSLFQDSNRPPDNATQDRRASLSSASRFDDNPSGGGPGDGADEGNASPYGAASRSGPIAPLSPKLRPQLSGYLPPAASESTPPKIANPERSQTFWDLRTLSGIGGISFSKASLACTKCQKHTAVPGNLQGLCRDCAEEFRKSQFNICIAIRVERGQPSRSVIVRSSLSYRDAMYVLGCTLGSDVVSHGLVARDNAGKAFLINQERVWQAALLQVKVLIKASLARASLFTPASYL